MDKRYVCKYVEHSIYIYIYTHIYMHIHTRVKTERNYFETHDRIIYMTSITM